MRARRMLFIRYSSLPRLPQPAALSKPRNRPPSFPRSDLYPSCFCLPDQVGSHRAGAVRVINVGLGETVSVSRMYSSRQIYARLERTTNLIARHPDFPGKGEAVSRCRED